jgi:hypothetical protein
MVDYLAVVFDYINTTLSNLSYEAAKATIKPLSTFVAGMIVYSVFIFKFYRFIARRDIFKLNLADYASRSHPALEQTLSIIFYILEHIVIFPVITFFSFLVLAVLMAFLAKEQTVQTIILVSISIVAAVRVTAYVHEDLSRDLAKMLPFALLGIFLVDSSYLNYAQSVEVIKMLPGLGETMVYYLIFVILLEIILRLIHAIFSHSKPKPEPKP